jgi:hypothetical protein
VRLTIGLRLAADAACVLVACAGAVLLGLALIDASRYARFLFSLLVH